MKKRLLSVLLAMCMVLGMLPGMAWAMDNDFIIENGVLTQYRGSGGNVAIPDSVSSIGDGAFAHSYNLTSVTIPNSVTSIGGDAFYGCRGLTNVVIPNSVTSIRGNVFRACTGLTTIQVEIGNPIYASAGGVLFNKSMDNLICCPSGKQGLYTIPNSVTHIGISAFYGCAGLTSVVIPSSVTDIGSNAFANCTGLTSATIPGSVTNIGGGSFNKCTALTDVTISDGVINIENLAFAGCTSLANVVVPNSITVIGSEAFYDCKALTNIAVPNSVVSIGNNTFTGCSRLTVIQVASSNPNYTSIDGVVFDKNISSLLFYPNGKQGSYTIPSSVKSIEYSAFRGCIGLTSVNIPGSVTAVGHWSFADCTSLIGVAISSGVTSIDSYAFGNCIRLTSIAIPSSVTRIDGSAFGDCVSLTDVYYSGTETQWKTINVMGGNTYLLNATIHYNSTGPDDSGDTGTQTASGVLRSGDNWKILWECSWKNVNGAPTDGKVDITMTGAANRTDDLYIYNENSDQGFPWELAPHSIPKSAIETLSISGELTGKRLRIAANSFQGYSNLETVLLDDVTGIDSYAFEGCSSLKSVKFVYAAELTTIGKGAFKNCTSLSEMEIPSNLTHIGDEAFQNTALGTITLGRGVTEIGNNAFSGCRNLKIRCYDGSVAHWYAQDNGIPFELIQEASTDTKVKEIPVKFYTWYDGVSDRTLAWGLDLFNFSAFDYVGNFAELGLTLSAATENSSAATEKLLNDLGFKTVKSENYSHSWEDIYWPGVTFGHQEINGKHYFIVAIRGTTDFEDFISDLYGFTNSASNIHSSLNSFISKICNLNFDETKENSKFFVTGHSLGGATANVLAKELSDEYGKENVYCYAFAPPKPIDWATGAANAGKYNNIFNIMNLEDPVTYLPNLWARYGKDITFHRWSTSEFDSNFRQLTGRNYALNHLLSAHDVTAYMAFVLTEQIGGTIRVVRCACPVDVEVYDSSSLLVGRVTDNVVSDTDAEKVFIRVEGDEKYLYLLADDEYTIRLTGTDTGTMTYSVQEVDMSNGEIKGETVFENVTLEPGKLMSSAASIADVSKVPLYVLGDNGQPKREILPDGNGTEVPIDTPDEPTAVYTITLDANGGSVASASLTTNTDGKLPSLPTPSRNGYSFSGWYLLDGTQVTANTVFTANATIYARWTYISSGGNSSSSSDYSPPIYSISVPSVKGGTVKVRPTSASKGSMVTITTVPNTGYELTTLRVSDKNGKELELSDKGDGKYAFVMPSGKVSIDAVFQMIQVPETPWSNPFSDVAENAWYYNAVKYVSQNGLMNGYSNSTFAPDAELSRGMLAQILYNKEGRPPVAYNNAFEDVADSAWYANAVAWTAKQNIVSGYGNGRFGPDNDITREQLAVILWRYEGSPTPTQTELRFTDTDRISDYALDALCWAVENGIINGKGGNILDPQGSATRAQVAQVLKNYVEK